MTSPIDVPRPLLEAAADELANYLKADGGCDHSVGICSCEITGIIAHLDHLLGRHEDKPDPYNRGSCVAETDMEELLGEQNPLEAIDLDE